MVEYCHDCGKRQPLVWWADDDLWERVMGTPGGAGQGGVVCPPCFWNRALDKGIFLHYSPNILPDRSSSSAALIAASSRTDLTYLSHTSDFADQPPTARRCSGFMPANNE